MRFSVGLTASWTYFMSDATSWAGQYFDPGRNEWIDSGFHAMNEDAVFDGVQSPGGFMAVLLRNDTTMTPWIFSTTFSPSEGDVWLFNLYLHGQAGDMILSSSSTIWRLFTPQAFSLNVVRDLASTDVWRLFTPQAFSLNVARDLASTDVWRLFTPQAFSLTVRRVGTPPPPAGQFPVAAVAAIAGATVLGIVIASRQKHT